MINTTKFSDFLDGGNLQNDSTTVGLKDGLNSVFNNPWVFLPPGTTADRPAPSAEINYRLRFNTQLLSYEFYNAFTSSWEQIEDSGDVSSLIARLAAHTAGDGASMIGLEDQPNAINKTVQDLANATIIARTNNGTLTAGQFLADLATGILKNTTGTGALSISAPLSSIDSLTTTSNQMLYTTASNVYAVTALTSFARLILAINSLNNAVLTTNGSGSPSMSNTLPTVVQDNITQLGTQAEALDMGSNLINNLADPVVAQDAATKAYVDAFAAGFNIHAACLCKSTSSFTVVYANGAAGVGATLTNAGAMSAFSADGVFPVVGNRVLIANQASAFQNGIYTVTTVGDGVTNWVLTRATDFDTTVEITPGDLVPITSGALYAGSSWMQTNTVTVIGTDPISFIQFSTSIPVSVPSGGTGNVNTTANGIITGGTTSTSSFQNIGTGTLSGQLVKSNGSGVLPSYTTATYPSTTTINGILYSSAADTVSEITSSIDSVLVTNGSGVPGFSTTLPAVSLVNCTNLPLTTGVTGILPVVNGGTGSNLSGTGGASQVLRQSTVGGSITVSQLSAADLSNTTTGTAGSAVVLAGGTPTFTGTPDIADATATTLNVTTTAGVTINSLKPVLTVKQQIFTASGTYTPSTGMLYCEVFCRGAGGGSGGCATTAGTQSAVSGAGGGGAYSYSLLTSATVGASQTVTIGAGGSAGTAGNNAGGAGGASSLGTLVIANGGAGGNGGPNTGAPPFIGANTGAGGTTGGTGDVKLAGGSGIVGVCIAHTQYQSSSGGACPGGTLNSKTSNAAGAAVAGTFGSGAAGGTIAQSTTQIAGAAGGNGYIVIIEYCDQ